MSIPEQRSFSLTIRDIGNDEYVFHRLRALLKQLLRRLDFRCERIAEGSDRAEIERLQATVRGLADRVAVQTELLSRVAENQPPVTPAKRRRKRTATANATVSPDSVRAVETTQTPPDESKRG